MSIIKKQQQIKNIINLNLELFAAKSAGSNTQNNRDSPGKRLGCKKSHGQIVKPGQIIMRQRGMKFGIGNNVFAGKDHTIHAKTAGKVFFFHLHKKTFVSVKSNI